MEADVYDCINGANGVTATLTWTFNYDGDDKTRPTSMVYETSYDGRVVEDDDTCNAKRQTFDNQ